MAFIGNQPYQVAFVTDTFSGNASTTAFTMSVAPANTSSVLVAVTGVLQDPSTYSVSGTTLTFSAAPPTGTGNISVRYLGIPASGVTTTAYRTVTQFTATAGQTTFTPPSYTAGFINVYRNGVLLGTADYTATNGTTVVLASGATSGDLVTVESFLVSSVLNAIPATSASIQQSYLASGVAGTGPAFSAYANAGQTLTNFVYTKISLQNEEFDTASCFNNTGSTVGSIPSYAFLPNVAGYYQVTGQVSWSAATATASWAIIYKNGSGAKYGSLSASTYGDTVSALIYMNGTTDYLELYCYQTSGQTLEGGSGKTYFQATLVRSA